MEREYQEESGGGMRMDLAALTERVAEDVRAAGDLGDVRGELTGERRANRPQIRITLVAHGEERVFLYHVQREGPVHTVARSLVEDTLRTVPQRILEGIGGRLQPNDVYYPSALGFTPTTIPGQPSGSARY